VIDFNDLDGFNRDDAYYDKNWVRHGVAAGECEEVFFNLPLILQVDLLHSQREDRYYILGQTNPGRYLLIAFSLRENKIRVISARDMSRKERIAYAKASA